MSSVWQGIHLLDLEIQSVELRNGVSLYFLSSKDFCVLVRYHYWKYFRSACIVLKFSLIGYLSTTQLLPCSLHSGEGEESEGKHENSRIEMKSD